MNWKAGYVAMTAMAAIMVAPMMSMPAGAQQATQVAGCDAGDKIDGTTAAQTKKKIEAAGYTQIRGLVKGCDNVWHATAVSKDGTPGNVMVTPQGQVKPEGN